MRSRCSYLGPEDDIYVVINGLAVVLLAGILQRIRRIGVFKCGEQRSHLAVVHRVQNVDILAR